MLRKKFNKRLLSVGAAGMLLAFSFAGAASAMTATCSGAPSATAVMWSGSASGGVEPYAFLWGNGATSSTQTVAAAAGTHSMTFQATDASSTVATTTCSATVVSAATSTDVAVKIQSLLAQIKALQAQIMQLIAGQGGGTGGTATSTPECFGFWRDLKHGDLGDDVKALQQQLAHDDPTLFPPGLITGFFGPKTQAAVKMWQRRYGIDPIGTGFFGQKSRGHVKGVCSNGDSDHDGVRNSEDSDDDDDGTPDTSDAFPFDKNATSSRKMMDDRRGPNGWKGENGKKGSDDDESDDD